MSEYEFPTITWNAINKSSNGNLVPVKTTTPSVDSTDAAEIILTDDDILGGDPALIDGERLLQVAATHTNQEIIEKVNSNHNAGWCDRSMTVRLTRVIGRVAKTQGRTHQEVKSDLDKLRERTGVFKRKNAMMGQRSKATKAMKKAQREELLRIALEKPHATDDANLEISNDDEVDEGYEGDLLSDLEGAIDESASKQVLLNECEALIQGDSSLLTYDNLLKVAGVFTNAEIVAKGNAGRTKPVLTSRKISDRLAKAIDRKAMHEGKDLKDVRAELKSTRQANGVLKRKNEYASQQRAIAMAAKKAREESSEASAMDIDEKDTVTDNESEDDDPLGDLEEIERREPEPVLAPSHSENSIKTPQTPAPFDGSRVGYMVDDDNVFVPGFRVY